MTGESANRPPSGQPPLLPRTSAQILGPFYPLGEPSPGGDLTRVPGRQGRAQGQIIYLGGRVLDRAGKPIRGAKLEIWQANTFGRYTHPNDDNPAPLDPNFEGFAVVHTDDAGCYNLKTIKPAAYPIPHDGPVGEMLEAQGRHPWRPAHVHFMISAPGFEQLVTHVFVAGDQYLDSDVVFGVKDSLIHEFVRCPPGRAPDGRMVDAAYFHLNYDFGLKQVASSAQAA